MIDEPLTPEALLTTTRAIRRRLDFDRPVPQELILECIDLAQHAPSGSNTQPWRWIIVRDPIVRGKFAELYRRSFQLYKDGPTYAGSIAHDDPARAEVQRKVAESAEFLAERLDDVPVLAFPCGLGRPAATAFGQAGFWGSVMPHVWSFMLAARSRGLGTTLTTMHLRFEEEAAELLGIPVGEVTQAGMLPVAFVRGDMPSATRRPPVQDIVCFDRWCEP